MRLPGLCPHLTAQSCSACAADARMLATVRAASPRERRADDDRSPKSASVFAPSAREGV